MQGDLPNRPHRQPDGNMWVRNFVCLANPERQARPTKAVKDRLKQNGLGRQKITFSVTSRASDLTEILEEHYPKLKLSDGFDILTQGGRSQTSQLELIEPQPNGYNVEFLRDHFGRSKATAYIRPRQALAMNDGRETPGSSTVGETSTVPAEELETQLGYRTLNSINVDNTNEEQVYDLDTQNCSGHLATSLNAAGRRLETSPSAAETDNWYLERLFSEGNLTDVNYQAHGSLGLIVGETSSDAARGSDVQHDGPAQMKETPSPNNEQLGVPNPEDRKSSIADFDNCLIETTLSNNEQLDVQNPEGQRILSNDPDTDTFATIEPGICSVEGGCDFIIRVIQPVDKTDYLVWFDRRTMVEARSPGGLSYYLYGLESIPKANKKGTHSIPVDVFFENNDNLIKICQCSLTYTMEKPSSNLKRQLSGDFKDGTGSYEKSTKFICDVQIYACVSGPTKLGVTTNDRLKNHREMTAKNSREHDHNKLAVAIKKSPRHLSSCHIIESNTLGDQQDSICTKRSISDSDSDFHDDSNSSSSGYGEDSNFEDSDSDSSNDSNCNSSNYGGNCDSEKRRPCYLTKTQNDIVLIIDINTFCGSTAEGVKLTKRRGSKANVRRLKHLMRRFGYTNVENHENLEAAEILDVVKNIAHKINGNSNSFVCFIGTHGDKGKIYGSDSQFIYVNDLTDAFKENNCPCLTGKPKLFFIEASGVGDSANDDSLNDSQFRSRFDPAEPHFLIGISLAPENVSFKNEEDGTWTTDVFVETFQNHYKGQDVLSMLVKVNKDVSMEHAKRGYKQPCQLVFTTTKIVKCSTTAGLDFEKDLEIDETWKRNGEATVQADRDDEYWSYPMKKQDNVAVIINVERFQKNNDEISEFDDREGSDNDVEKLEQLWKNLGFNVKVPEDLKKENILEFLKQVREDIVENSSCFVCCIMTHGHMGTLYGSDSEPLDISAIIDLFKESNCPALARKPKMFFIQACRSICKLYGAWTAQISYPCDGRKNTEFSRELNPTAFTRVNPHETDFFIGFSTLPGARSYRHRDGGTFYMNALVEIFQEYHKDEDLMSMMTRVNKKLVENEHFQQCPGPVLTLTGKVYFSSNA